MEDRIRLRGIRFFGRHGADRRERRVGQWYSVDLDMHLDLRPAGESDDLTQTVNYADVCRVIMELGTKKQFHLIEALAEQISQRILNSYAVQRVRVRVEKSTPADLTAVLSGLGTLHSATVDIVRTSDDASKDRQR